MLVLIRHKDKEQIIQVSCLTGSVAPIMAVVAVAASAPRRWIRWLLWCADVVCIEMLLDFVCVIFCGDVWCGHAFFINLIFYIVLTNMLLITLTHGL